MASRACHGVPMEQVDEHFLAAAARLTAAPNRRELDLTAAQALVLFDAQLGSRHLDLAARGPARQGRGLLHDRLRGPRGQRGGRRGAATDRPRAAALPFRRVLPGQGRARWRAATRCVTCCSVWSRRPRSRSPGPAQGVRHPDAGGHPADLDDRLAPAPRARRGVRDRPAPARSAAQARGRPTPWWSAASGTPRPTIRRRPARSTPRSRSAFRRLPLPLLLVCEDNGIGISVPTPEGWVGARLRAAAGPAVLRRRRLRPGRRRGHRGRGRPSGFARTAARRCCTCAPCG